MSVDRKILVGSRKSELALIQTRHVISLLKEVHPEKEFDIVTMSTLGDKVLDIPLPKIGEKSLFTKELETALSTGLVDFVVHSLKDLPTTLPDGMAIGAVLRREDPRDALVLHKDLKDLDLKSLPNGSVIGTSSLRRAAQLHRKYPHLKVEDIRGNLNTRLRKLDELGKFSAVILAVAGLHRMGWQDRVTEILESEDLLYAIGQGALAVECRENDNKTIELLSTLYDPQTAIRVITERTFLQKLGGGCSAPVAISTEISNLQADKHKMSVTGAVWSLDGKDEITDSMEITINLRKSGRCPTCPYNHPDDQSGSAETKAACSLNNDSYEVPTKKKRSSEEEKRSPCENGNCDRQETKQCPMKSNAEPVKIPVEVLDSDPHAHCPVAMPVGADFMGKCPFLEANPTAQHVDVDVAKAGGSLDVSKCPYFKSLESAVDGKNGDVRNENSNDLYCGLVAHKAVPVEVMAEARKLGVELADRLIANGALTVMAKAQAFIRNS